MSCGGERFLIVRLSSLGDVIHAIPFAAALRARHPKARIDWLVESAYVGMLSLVRGLDDIIGIDPRSGTPALVRAVRRLRRRQYSAVFDLQGLLKSAVFARLAGATRTLGFHRAHLREGAARIFYTSSVDPGAEGHVIRKNLSMLDAAGGAAAAPAIEFPLDVPTTDVSERIAAEFDAGAFVALNIGAAWPNKVWPADRFGAVAHAIQQRLGLRSLVVWGPGERDMADAVVAAAAGAAIAAPATSIVDLVAVLARARIVVSGDTGPVHIAGAVGTPIVGLYGPTNPQRNGPWSATDVIVSRYATCSCSYQRRCHMPSRCIDTIAVTDVVDAVERRLAAGR